MAVGHALERIFEVGIGLDPTEFCGCEKRGDDGPSIGAAVGAGEQMVLASQRHRPDGALYGVVIGHVDRDASVPFNFSPDVVVGEIVGIGALECEEAGRPTRQ